MARGSESQRNEEPQARVYKAGAVHKRRLNRKDLPKVVPDPVEADAADERPPRDARRTHFSDMPVPPADGAVQRKPAGGLASAAIEGEAPPAQAPASEVAASSASVPESRPSLTERIAKPLVRRRKAGEAESNEASPGTDVSGSKDVEGAEQGGEMPSGQSRPDGAGEAPGADAPAAGAQAAGPNAPDAPGSANAPDGASAPDAPDAASAPDAADSSRESSAAKPKHPKRRIVIVVVAIVVVCALAVAGFFAWNRWLRYDDHADMQGQWYVVGTIVPVTIEEGGIRLTDDVSYEYSIDEHDKTIQFSFGPMKGQGNYCFSDDRQYLVITDGNEYSAATMSAEELVRTFRDLVAASEGASTSMSGKLGITALRRIPSPIVKIMKEAEAQAEAARKAAEERAKREAEEQAAREAAEEQAAAQAAAEAAAQETAGSYYYYYPEDATAADAGAAYYDTGAYADYYVDASAYGYEETYAGEAAY